MNGRWPGFSGRASSSCYKSVAPPDRLLPLPLLLQGQPLESPSHVDRLQILFVSVKVCVCVYGSIQCNVSVPCSFIILTHTGLLHDLVNPDAMRMWLVFIWR